MTITLVGLGYGDARGLTVEAQRVLRDAREIFVTTRAHPALSVRSRRARVRSFDDVKPTRDPVARARRIAEDVLARAAVGDVVYATPGHPLVDDVAAPQILARAREQHIATRLVAGVSWMDAACSALGLAPRAQGLQIADARTLARQYFPHLDPDQPALIRGVSSRALARACQQRLALLYPRAHPVTRLDAFGTAAPTLATQSIGTLARARRFAEQTTWYIPPLAQPSSWNALGEVVAHLRAPEGCPWDRVQTHQSLRKDFLEECYEVLETLDANDVPHLREELGDLLLHIFLQAQIAAEADEFLLTDVIADIAAKLVRRHPHVFGDVQVSGTDEIFANWERIKQTERNGAPPSALPRALPALARAQKIAKRAQFKPSAREVQQAVAHLVRAPQRTRAVGEALFALAAFAATHHIDAESALRAHTRRAK
jgi:tetrapyrrole methylase family protein/MazG family protein